MAERMAGKSSRRRIPESEAVEREFSPEPVARSAIAVKNLLVLDPESDRKQLKEERDTHRSARPGFRKLLIISLRRESGLIKSGCSSMRFAFGPQCR